MHAPLARINVRGYVPAPWVIPHQLNLPNRLVIILLYSSQMADLEAADPETAFNAIIEQISAQLFQANSKINGIRKLQTTLSARFNNTGSQTSIQGLQKRIHELVNDTNTIFKEIGKPKAALERYVYNSGHSYSDTAQYSDAGIIQITKNQSLQKEKIVREVAASVRLFQQTQEEFKSFIQKQELQQLVIQEEEQKQRNERQPDQTAQTAQPLVKELDPINNEELVYHAQMVSQREREIEEIQESMEQINAIYRDLDTMVTEQGEMVDSIETNILGYNDNARGAARELVAADRYQRRASRTKKCLMTLCATVIFMLMVLVLALT